MRVVAVSSARPQWVDVRGRQVFTSILHEPSDGPLQFGGDGPVDNATAVHTEQVLAFSAQHYDHWTRVFGIPRDAWGWCHWGENLTIDGLDETVLQVGDRLQIGDAVFEVTSPRIPCFKLAWRIGQADSVLLELIQSGKIGVYLRVVVPGTVRADDRVTHTPCYGDSITVADLSRLLIDRDANDPAKLRRILDLPALGGQASGMLARRAAQLEETQRSSNGRWDGWRDFRIETIESETASVRSFLLRALDGAPVAAALPGQFVTVRLPNGLVRTWSVSNYAAATYRLTIKQSATASSWMCGEAQTGTILSLRAPAGRFVLPHGLLRPVLISAGIGVTPLVAMLHAHAARGGGPLHWLHVARDRATHALRDEVERVLQANPSFTQQIHYTSEAGRFGAAHVDELLARPYTIAPFGRAIELAGADSDFYICGPRDFETMVRGALLRSGVGASHIFSESFSPHGAADETGDAIVRFGAVETRWTHGSLLELAERAGLSPPSGCRVGACQSCAARLVAGSVRYDPAPFVQPESGTVLLCCARPASAVLEVDL